MKSLKIFMYALMVFLLVFGVKAFTPTVTLISPEHNEVIAPGTIMFAYNVTSDYQLKNCSLYTNETGSFEIKDTNNSVSNGTNTFTETFTSRAMITWNIKCYDNMSFAWGTPRVLFIDNAPSWALPLPPQTIQEDSGTSSFNLSGYAADADGDALTYYVAEENTSQVDCQVTGEILYFTPAPNFNGDATCKVGVSDGMATDETTMLITVQPVEDAPVIEAIADQNIVVDKDFSLQVNAYDPDGDSITYSLTQKPEGMNISTSGLITWHPTETGTYAVTVQVSDGTLSSSESFNIEVGTPQKLEIYDVDITVDGSRNNNVGEGDIVDVKPESDVTVKVQVKNMYTSTEKVDINDVVITVTAVAIDDGDDIEEETREFDIRYNSIITKTIDFKIPLKVDEGEYDLIIHAEGEDEDGYTQEAEITAKLNVEKKNHAVEIKRAEVYPTEVSCDRTVDLDVEVINLGRQYEDEAALSVESPSLKFVQRENFELSNDPYDEDSTKTFHYTIDIPEDLRAGTYTITIKTYYDEDIMFDYKTLTVKVKDCEKTPTPTQTPTETPTPTIIVETPTPGVTAVPVQRESFTESTTYLVLLIAANVLVVGIILLMIARMLRR